MSLAVVTLSGVGVLFPLRILLILVLSNPTSLATSAPVAPVLSNSSFNLPVNMEIPLFCKKNVIFYYIKNFFYIAVNYSMITLI